MMTLAELKRTLLANPETSAAYAAQAPEYALVAAMIAARVAAGLTQAQVAERMGTTQSTVARWEGGRALPSIRTLNRYAAATGTQAVIRFELHHE